MSITPRISLVAWTERSGGFIFVAVPNERGRYLRTDRSVALVGCPMCSAAVGEPCKGYFNDPQGYGATTHHKRRSLARAKFGHALPGADVLHPQEMTPDEWMEPAA